MTNDDAERYRRALIQIARLRPGSLDRGGFAVWIATDALRMEPLAIEAEGRRLERENDNERRLSQSR